MKLKVKITIIIGLLMILAITGVSVMLLTRMRSIQIELTMEDMRSGAGLYAMELKAYYEKYMHTAMVTAQIQSNFETIEPDRRRQRFGENLKAVFEQNTEFDGIYTVWKPGVLDGLDSQFRNAPGCDEAGNFVPYYTRESGQNELKTAPDHLTLIQNISDQQDVSNPEASITGGEMHFIVHFRAPVYNRQGETVGITGVVANMNYSRNLVDSISPYGEGRAELYTNNRTIIASHDKSIIGMLIQDAKVDRFGIAGIRAVEQSFAEQQPVTIRNNALLIQTYPFNIGTAPDTWLLAISTPLQTVMRNVNSMTTVSIVIAAAAVFLSSLAGWVVAQRIAKPISGISETLKSISEGEGDLTKTIAVAGKSEIGDLAHYFNLTLKKIRELIIIIKEQTAALFNIGNELASSMEETAAAINQITVNIQSIKTRVINQSASVTETNSTMEQITVNIDKLNGHIERQAASVSQSSSAIEQMIANIKSVTETLVNNSGNVRELAEASALGQKSLEEVTDDIRNIARESEGILEINAVMENIASQTNLLSMNAAIEAAHAGEAGKGFAVVAGEIRKLAESSGAQSKTISEVLKKIKTSIDKISRSAANVLTKFEAINLGIKIVSDQEAEIRKAMEEQSAGSRQVMETLGQLNGISRQVKDGSMEMLEGSREVILESQRLEKVTQEISGGMNEMALGADQINSAVNEVNTVSGHNKENIDILVKEVSRFKVE
jgi:methyl-accepting chemotaxis protein